jgi:hypothetical protein
VRVGEEKVGGYPSDLLPSIHVNVESGLHFRLNAGSGGSQQQELLVTRGGRVVNVRNERLVGNDRCYFFQDEERTAILSGEDAVIPGFPPRIQGQVSSGRRAIFEPSYVAWALGPAASRPLDQRKSPQKRFISTWEFDLDQSKRLQEAPRTDELSDRHRGPGAAPIKADLKMTRVSLSSLTEVLFDSNSAMMGVCIEYWPV